MKRQWGQWVAAVFIGFLGLLWATEAAMARDLQGRLGLGYNSQFVNSVVASRVPGVSVKYALTRDIALEAIVGSSTASPSNSVTAVKFFKNLFLETNLNFYFTFGGGIVAANQKSGSEFLGALGAEFFIPGLESLGLAFEAGGSVHNLTGDGFSFRTIGVSFLDAGIRFYF
ncbi:MAG: hypothetical protein KGQ59_03780 [Bdellovibrionales bacterium]|nr:hypothetical protein [Bdellovibrionales bacterium]